jgi:hypothetical protein
VVLGAGAATSSAPTATGAALATDTVAGTLEATPSSTVNVNEALADVGVTATSA